MVKASIQSKDVKSLTLSDDDETPGQIGYFLSLFRINHFTGLRSLTLLEIDDCHLSIILKDIRTLSLNSLSIDSKRDYSQHITTLDDLSSAISSVNLYKLNLNIPGFDISQIVWPFECKIRHLKIDCRTLDEYCHIYHQLPNLRTFVMGQLDKKQTDETIPKYSNLKPFGRLVSLTFKYCSIDMTILQLILSLAPSLEHLQLMRSIDSHTFTAHLPQWEKFVATKLPLLKKFDFFLVEDIQFVATPVNTESIIAPFRTPFWSETKHWFAICDYIVHPRTVILYSSSFFGPQFEYVYESKEILRSTSAQTINNRIIMDGVRKLRLDLTKVIPFATSPQSGLPNNVIFPKLGELTLHIPDQWPLGALRYLSSLIDLSHINKLSLEIYNSFNLYSESISNISLLFKLAHNTRSLTISIYSGFGCISDHTMQIYSLIPTCVRHLTVSIYTVNQMYTVLHQLKHQSSIRFDYTSIDYSASEMHLAWFERESGYYTYRLNNSSLHMWFDKNVITL